MGHLGGCVGYVPAFGSGCDLRVLGSSPTSVSLLSMESATPSAYCSPAFAPPRLHVGLDPRTLRS